MDTEEQLILTYYEKLNENYNIWKDEKDIQDILNKNNLSYILKTYHPYLNSSELSSLTIAVYLFMLTYARNI